MSPPTKTYTPKASEIDRKWRVIDATGRPLGRLASEIAQILKGKDKPTYTPNMDTGDFVIVVNAAKVYVSGKKSTDKLYYTHSMYPGGFKATPFDTMLAKHPRRVIEWAVWGMLPKNVLGRILLRKLKVYAEETHPHGAQIKDLAGPERVGKPGKPRPARKLKIEPAEEPVAAEAAAEEPILAEAPAEEPVAAEAAAEEPILAEAPAEEPVAAEAAAEEPIAAEAAAEEPVAAEAAAEEPVAAEASAEEPIAAEAPAEKPDTTPLTPPTPRTRSRRAKAQEAKPARRRTKKSSDEESVEESQDQEA